MSGRLLPQRSLKLMSDNDRNEYFAAHIRELEEGAVWGLDANGRALARRRIKHAERVGLTYGYGENG